MSNEKFSLLTMTDQLEAKRGKKVTNMREEQMATLPCVLGFNMFGERLESQLYQHYVSLLALADENGYLAKEIDQNNEQVPGRERHVEPGKHQEVVLVDYVVKAT